MRAASSGGSANDGMHRTRPWRTPWIPIHMRMFARSFLPSAHSSSCQEGGALLALTSWAGIMAQETKDDCKPWEPSP